MVSGEPQFVARARHEGELIPGKLVASHNVAYIPYAGGEHPHTDYEVLVGCTPNWIQGILYIFKTFSKHFNKFTILFTFHSLVFIVAHS